MKTYLEFIAENRLHIHYFEHEGAKGHVEDDQVEGSSKLVSGIASSDRGKGHAHEVMKKITRHLDKRGDRAHLHPLAIDDHMDPDRLRGFYRKHGFRDDPSHKSRMIRDPRDLTEAKLVKDGSVINVHHRDAHIGHICEGGKG